MIELRWGAIYIITGRGEMLLDQLPNKHNVAVMRKHGWEKYYVDVNEIVREADQTDLDARHEQAEPRGLDCKHTKCWCRKQDNLR